MPSERLSMRRIRELLRLNYENGLPGRTIATSLGLSKGAVNDYLQRTRAAGLSWPLPAELTDTPPSTPPSPRVRGGRGCSETWPIRGCGGPRR